MCGAEGEVGGGREGRRRGRRAAVCCIERPRHWLRWRWLGGITIKGLLLLRRLLLSLLLLVLLAVGLLRGRGLWVRVGGRGGGGGGRVEGEGRLPLTG